MRGTGTARRWKDGRTDTCCRRASGPRKLQTRLEAGASADGEHCEKIEGRADGHVLKIQTRLKGRCECG